MSSLLSNHVENVATPTEIRAARLKAVCGDRTVDRSTVNGRVILNKPRSLNETRGGRPVITVTDCAESFSTSSITARCF